MAKMFDSFYGDSIFYHSKDELDDVITQSSEDSDEFDLIFNTIDDVDTVVDEGTNIDIWKSFNDCKKAYRDDIKKAHKYMRSKHWIEASYYLDTAKKDINDCKREVKSIKSDSMTSATFGILVNTTLSMVMDIIPGMSYIIGMDRSSNIGKDVMNSIDLPKHSSKASVEKALIKDDISNAAQLLSAKSKCETLLSYANSTGSISITSIIKSTIHILDDTYSIIKAFKNDKNNRKLTTEKLNIYKSNIIKTLDSFSSVIDKESKAVKEKQKEESRKS